MQSIYKGQAKNNYAFTIVELLIVIIIIGILATITIVSYIGISKRATEATLKSDLANASKKLSLYFVDQGQYPQDLDANGCPTTPINNNYCIKSSAGNIFDYTATSPYLDYTLTVEKGDNKFKILGSDTTPIQVNTTPVTAIAAISGTAKEGQVLSTGTITPAGATVTYQWQSAATSGGTYTNIAGATNSTYTPTASDIGKYIKVQITGTGDYRDTVTSVATTVIVASTPPITGIGAITGTAQIGQTLSAGAVTPAGATVSYQWQSATTAGGTYTNIPGATSSTFTITPGNMSKYFKVVVTGTGGYAGTQTSAASAQVASDANWKLVGNQVWAAANLNVGTLIASTSNQTNNAAPEKYCYNNSEANCTAYGGLYQWDELMQYSTAEGARGLCPVNSHIPTDNDWKILEMSLGMTQAQADGTNWRGTTQGTQLMAGGSSGINLPVAGARNPDGSFTALTTTYYWSSTVVNATDSWFRLFMTSQPSVSRLTNGKVYGVSVRCIAN